MTYIKTITGNHVTPEEGGLRSPNDLFAVPGADQDAIDAFYVTNDNYYADGWMQKLETIGRFPWAWVSFYSSKTGWRLAARGMMSSNGITGTKSVAPGAPQRIYINEVAGGRVSVHDRTFDETTGTDGNLTYVTHLIAGFLLDNPTLSYPSEKDLYLAGFPQIGNFASHVGIDPSDPARLPCAAGVARVNTKVIGNDFYGGAPAASLDDADDHDELKKKRNLEPGSQKPVDMHKIDENVEELLIDEHGRLANCSTTAVFDEMKQTLYVSSITNFGKFISESCLFCSELIGLPGILRCKNFK